LSFAHNALVGIGLRDRIRLGASGKITSAFDLARVMALGADWGNSARGFMFALGCIQAQTCHTGQCPTGVTAQDPLRERALVVPDKAERVANFHKNTLHALGELVAAAGLSHPRDLQPQHFLRRASSDRVISFAEQYAMLSPRQLIDDPGSAPAFAAHWAMASADHFARTA
jgi:glutamate synthase domain-containing protein 2